MSSTITAESCTFCYIDLDWNNHRKKLATAAAFVDATNTRYGFSSKNLRHLGGSEVARISELISTDHGTSPLSFHFIPARKKLTKKIKVGPIQSKENKSMK